MRAFIIELENRPGTLADLCEAIGEANINVSGLAGASRHSGGAVALITSNDAGMRALLEARHADYREAPVVSATLDDRPGTLGEAARRLGDSGVNVEAIIPTGVRGLRVSVAFAVDDEPRGRQALADLAQRTTSSI